MAGSIYYIAKVPQNEFPIPFRLVENNGLMYIFENQNHDFPQRIIYHRVNEDSLEVKISDIHSTKEIYFYFIKK